MGRRLVLEMAAETSLNGSVGNAAHPEWLRLSIANGGLTLNGSGKSAGYVIAPQGTVTLNGGVTLIGEVISDRLTINGSAQLVEP